MQKKPTKMLSYNYQYQFLKIAVAISMYWTSRYCKLLGKEKTGHGSFSFIPANIAALATATVQVGSLLVSSCKTRPERIVKKLEHYSHKSGVSVVL